MPRTSAFFKLSFGSFKMTMYGPMLRFLKRPWFWSNSVKTCAILIGAGNVTVNTHAPQSVPNNRIHSWLFFLWVHTNIIQQVYINTVLDRIGFWRNANSTNRAIYPQNFQAAQNGRGCFRKKLHRAEIS